MERDTWDNLTGNAAKTEEEGNTEGAGNYFTFSLIYTNKDTVKPVFEVISFTGNENLSFVYDFYVTLRSPTDNIPSLLGEVLLRPAVLCIVVQEHFAYYHGIVTEFRQVKRVGDYTQYELRLRAKMFLPYLNTRSDIYVGKKFSDIIDGVMKDNDFTSLDYELKLTGNHYDPLPGGYNRWSYVCQYEESDLNFLQRLMEREGVYYYYVQDQTWHESLQDVKSEKMIVSDSKVSHSPAKKTLQYKQAGAPGPGPAPETIFTMIMHQAAFPAKVVLRNYNYDKAGMGTISATADVGPKTENTGRVQTIYGENFSTTEEGQTLAGIRAEEIFCQTKVYYGIASGPGLTPGTLITIEDSGQTFSGDYLIIHADHEGKQPLTGIEEEFEYNNTFTMIPAAVQYRPQRLTPKPKIHATMNAVIDGTLSTETPDIDATFGRYKVRLPFALEKEGDDFSKKWGKSTDKYHVRMASPYAGTDNKTHGMNFPLHKGVEVVLSFRDGDPDLPVISGAVFNSQNFNVVTDNNPKQHVIKTPGGNQFVMDDTPGKEFMYLFSPFGSKGNWIYLGQGGEGTQEGAFKGQKGDKGDTGNTGDTGEKGDTGESGKEPGSVMHVKSSGDKHELVLGQEDSFVIGSENYVTIGSRLDAILGTSSEFALAVKTAFELAGNLEFRAGHHVEFGKTKDTIKDEDELMGTEKITISAGLPFGEKAVLSTLAKTLVFGGAAVAALLAAAGGDLGALVFPDEASGVDAMKQMGVGMAPIVVGTALQVAALEYLIKKLNTGLTNPISQIELDDSGIKIHAGVMDSNFVDNDGIQMGIGADEEYTSFLKIMPTGVSTSVEINNEDSYHIMMWEGESVVIEKIENDGGQLTIDADQAILQKEGGGGIVTVNNDGVHFLMRHGASMEVDQNSVIMASPNAQNGIEVSNVGINVTFNQAGVFHAGPLEVDGAGFIKLG
ncbi:MAG: type VI secretion system tip protein TssI/VgrG [Deltaproteobacteria bacterium]|nr:type VI secretion system tip protein TssI/VgrG [Deltaproteobacteria bacterium]